MSDNPFGAPSAQRSLPHLGAASNRLALSATRNLEILEDLEPEHSISLAIVVLLDRREVWREEVARYCAPWFDGSAFV